MGWMTRFEPATSGSTDRRSNQLSYIHHKSVLYYTNFPARVPKLFFFGTFLGRKIYF